MSFLAFLIFIRLTSSLQHSWLSQRWHLKILPLSTAASHENYLDEISMLETPPPKFNTGISDGDGRESGIRFLTPKESQACADRWISNLGIANSPRSIEMLEKLLFFRQFSLAMPGRHPQRNELVTTGEFLDGKLQSVCCIYWKKVMFPQEIEVLSLLSAPGIDSNQQPSNLLDFVSELCADNAIIANYTLLENEVDGFCRSPAVRSFLSGHHIHNVATASDNNHSHSNKRFRQRLRRLYEQHNPAPLLCLDGLTPSSLGQHWFELSLQHSLQATTDSGTTAASVMSIKLYFRQKRWRDYEYELTFTRPSTGVGTGSGTASGHVILPVPLSSTMTVSIDNIDWAMVKMVAEAISKRIIHPSIEDIRSLQQQRSSLPPSSSSSSSQAD